MFRPIRLDHTNCLQVAIKTHSFCFLQGLVTKTNPRLTEDKRAQAPFPTLQCQGKRLIHTWWNVTYLPIRSLPRELPPITM
jgi:hypothetical protein